MCKVAVRTESDLTAKRSTSRNKQTITDLIIIAGTTPHGYYPQSQYFSRSYISNLPTSLIYIILIDQRLLTLET